ncbi:MAG: glycosyltransferase family 2 protein [Desulfobacteraceae bacterium]|jgi:glycosyltransferase involved in cell wall biosynthesis|nr:glycosyltransferase family 2 protein [Desulfobacteraceae bacterium]
MPLDPNTTTPNVGKKGKFAVIIPVYNHENGIDEVVKKSLKLNLPVFVVDDGSTDSSCEKIRNYTGIYPLRHAENRGKGAAIMTGFIAAEKIADWAITIDADGQHDPQDALHMMAAIPQDERPLVVGMRQGMVGKKVPWTSRFGRKFSNFWVVLSGGPRMADSQSGFRIYPLPESLKLNVTARRFQFEVEILVKAGWEKLPVIEMPVSVSYAPGKKRISHFRPFIDFLRNTCTFSRLITQRILIRPFVRKPLK